MARARSIDASTTLNETLDETRPSEVVDVSEQGYGAEFRELARQRRFVRSAEPASDVPATWHAAVTNAAPSEPGTRVRGSARISDDQRSALAELTRMSQRLVESREQLAVSQDRAARMEADLVAANRRLMAAHVLVQDAQRATRESAERNIWLEARCDTLQEALEIAVNASIFTRLRWRRQQRAAGN